VMAGQVTELIRTKLDWRSFSDRPVSREDVIAILDAARWAGSGKNTQHWRFILIEDKEELRWLAEHTTTGLWLKGAAFAVIVTTDASIPYHQLDAGRAIANMQLEAWSRGITSCITTGYDQSVIRQRYGIPEKRAVDAIVGFGYPDRPLKGKKSRKPLSELVHVGRYGNPLKV
jgi:nitroreductase